MEECPPLRGLVLLFVVRGSLLVNSRALSDSHLSIFPRLRQSCMTTMQKDYAWILLHIALSILRFYLYFDCTTVGLNSIKIPQYDKEKNLKKGETSDNTDFWKISTVGR
jgi:hypothetical protein